MSSQLHWNDVTAVFGGCFDPPHLGHREAVRGLFQFPGIKEVVIIPSGSAPHKPTLASASQRKAMTELNFGSLPFDSYPLEVRVDCRELERAEQNPGVPNYSFDTISELRTTYPRLAFVIGTDQLVALSSWYRFPELLILCHWIVLERKPQGSSQARKTLQEWETSGLVHCKSPDTWESTQSGFQIKIVPTRAKDISSTQIRESVARSGALPPETVLPSVKNYIVEQQLYGI